MQFLSIASKFLDGIFILPAGGSMQVTDNNNPQRDGAD
jgi:hypothetical protein